MLGRRFALAGAFALVLSGSLVVQTADPARAADFPGYVTDYLLSVPGEQLYANNTPTAKAAWQGNMDAYAARSAAGYSAAAMFGNITPDRVAGVVPINSVRNPDLPKTPWSRFKTSMTSLNVPFTGAQPGYKPKVGTGGAVIAATAYAFRGEVANGVLSLFGMDANAAVCGHGGNGGFVNFITGQDCSMYEQSDAMLDAQNDDFVAGLSAGESCGTYTTAYGQVCVKPLGSAVYNGTAYPCFSTPEPSPAPSGTRLYVASYTAAGVLRGNMLDLRAWGDSTPLTGPANSCATKYGGTANVSTFPADFNQPYPTDGVTAKWGICFSGSATSGRSPLCSALTAATATTVTNLPTDPPRWIECKIHWSNGSIQTGTTATFTESEGAYPDPVCPTAPAGATPDRMTLTVMGSGLTPYVYFDQEATDEYAAFMADHAECIQDACFLDVVQVETGLSCFSPTITDSCREWFTDPARDTKYKCQYGGKDKPMQSCYVYANVFNADKRAAGLAYVDPLTGEEVPGAVTSTRADEYAMGQGIRPGGATAPRSCWGGTAAWSPVDWVLRPIQCAAEWAFVPRPAVVDEALTDLDESYQLTPAGAVGAAVGGWSVAPVMTGCKITYTHWNTGQLMTAVDACPGSTFAPVAQISRVLSVAGAVVTAIALYRRIVGGTVDFKGN